MLKVKNKNTKTRCQICLKLTRMSQERCHWHHSGVFIVNFEDISQLLLLPLVNFSRKIPTGLIPTLTRLKKMGLRWNSLPWFSKNLRKSIHNIEQSSNLWKLWDLFWLLFAHMYRAIKLSWGVANISQQCKTLIRIIQKIVPSSNSKPCY